MVYFVNASKDLVGSIISFFGTFTLFPVPGTNLSLPAPINPGAFIGLYVVVFQFCLGLGILEMMVLALRILLHSPVARKAETVENVVFWLATSYLLITYLVNASIISEWFVFWSAVIIIGGIITSCSIIHSCSFIDRNSFVFDFYFPPQSLLLAKTCSKNL